MDKKFNYTYLAPTEAERREIENIQKQYIKCEKNEKLIRLRKLDSKIKNLPTCISLVFGIIGALIFGVGLTMVLEWNLILWGALIGALGCIVMAPAYFIYNKIVYVLKEKYSKEIVDLSNELLNIENKD